MKVRGDILRPFVASLFRATGVPAAEAEQAAALFVLQESRGVLTHGLRRVQRYLLWLRAGQVNPAPQRRVLRDSDSVVVLDGDHGIGLLGCMDAMERAMAKSKNHGLGIGVVINNNHFLSAAPYVLRAAEAGLIGIACSNTHPAMGYPGTASRVIGNGPLGFAVPTGAGYPLVFDAAMTASYGKLTQWMRSGATVPADLPTVDAAGNPTSDPKAVLDGGTTLPIGMHKGAGLVLLIEILTGVLGGGAFLSAILPPEARTSKRQGESQCCIAIDIAHFMPPAEFESRMAALIADLKSQPRAAGCDEIRVPGEHAHRCQVTAEREGIPLAPDLEQELRDLARMVGVAVPF